MPFSPKQQSTLPNASLNLDLRSGNKRPRGLVRTKLLDTAERLFGQHGVEGVSLREIALAAGQRNVSAVNYYFKDKQGLVEELISDRFLQVETGRQNLIDGAADLNSCECSDLLTFLWQPIVDLCARRGGNWFIQFHLSYLLHNSDEKHPFITMPDQFPASSKLLGALQVHSSHLPLEQYRYRLGLIFMMFWMALSRYDAEAAGQDWATINPLTEPIKVGVAALAAPA
jgi:AcrR family transcriptional regulator